MDGNMNGNTNNDPNGDQQAGGASAPQEVQQLGQFSNEQAAQNPYNAGQNPYGAGQAPYQPAYQPELEEPVSILDYVGSLLLFNLVPCVGLIICIVWAFSKDTKKSKANFCKAYLIMTLVGLVIGIIVVIAMFGFIGALSYEIMDSVYYNF